MSQFLSIIKSSLGAFALLMHNKCLVQKYKETKALTQVKYECSAMLSFDETQRGMCTSCSNNRGCPFILDVNVQITVSFLWFLYLRIVSILLCTVYAKYKKRT